MAVARGCRGGWSVVASRAARSPRFFPDDPIQVDDDRALDASGTKEIEGSNAYDFAENTFLQPGDTARHPRGQRQLGRRSARLDAGSRTGSAGGR